MLKIVRKPADLASGGATSKLPPHFRKRVSQYFNHSTFQGAKISVILSEFQQVLGTVVNFLHGLPV